MQFHLTGYCPGDPSLAPAAPGFPLDPATLPQEVDVLIVGCGPTGLITAAQLAAFPAIRTCITDQKPGPLAVGQADGIACRSVEMFEAFGFAEKVLKEAYWVNETAFWKPDPKDPARIARSGRIEDTEEGLSEFPHVILNQARVHDFFLEVMRNAPTRLAPHYRRRLISLKIDEGAALPVTATFEHTETGAQEVIRARYAVGADGARSTVRREIGRSLDGAAANQAWGVMDVLCTTDFPDIRLKATVHSAREGNLLVIPREGGYMVRLYIEMDKLAEDERVASKNITVDHLIAAAQRILHPYTLDVKEVAWWSVYEIGQRICAKFDNLPDDVTSGPAPSVFIAGDACHTHSPKAGQGMNVSLRDGFNLGWKLAAVLRGQAHPEILHTYAQERKGEAQALIDFDREFAAMFSAKPATKGGEGVDPKAFQQYFERHGRFTAGVALRYGPSMLTGSDQHQALAPGFQLGMRFHSAPVIRLADARPMQLGHVAKADGRWRLLAFAPKGDQGAVGGALHTLCRYLSEDPRSPLRRYTPKSADSDGVIDLRAVLQMPHREVQPTEMPTLLRPTKGLHGLVDAEKVFCPDPRAGDIFDLRGIDRKEGALVVLRPDQHVAALLPLADHVALAAFFDGIMIAAD